ncbi:MAG: pyridoxal 5'-phosphate synthase glutaminase subunit PdxT [Desulfurococcales archaeon]|nr:pyridoxal 5'-phosphate synthase glutaminase subunit PdxT [Desulfurococcales archaeon]
MVRVGIVALQGGVSEHYYMVRRAGERIGLGVEPVLLKKPGDLRDIDAVIIPGGESTTIGIVAKRTGLLDELREAILGGLPVLSTCAGAIIMAKKLAGTRGAQPILGVMDVEVHRNYFGRQRESFEVDLNIDFLSGPPFRGVFIRAPAFTDFWGDARPAAAIEYNGRRVYVAAVERAMIATSFHPELTGDTRIHEYLLSLAKK